MAYENNKAGNSKGGGMKEFQQGHWQKDLEDVSCCDLKYSSEMNQAQEYKESVDKLANYAKKHKAEH
jgi:hypothetical protein